MLSFFKQLLYVQLAPHRLTVRNPKTCQSVSEEPELAMHRDSKGKMQIAGVGTDARMRASEPGIELVNPFTHPRSLLSDFSLAQQVLRQFIRKLQSSSFFRPAPTIIMHPLVEPVGGFTQIERRAMQELALGAGASNVTLWFGPPLSDQDLLSGQFPHSGAAAQE